MRLIFLLLLPICCTAQVNEWWKNTIVYQIYPRSFQDSNGDGIGDLQGIISRLDHFTDLGIQTIWLSPIYKSPQADFGYDVSDFEDIDPIYGSMADFEQLLDEAHRRDLKVVLDFIPNHSSDRHDWFIQSVQRVAPYDDYYVWQDPSGVDSMGQPLPPNNWLSVFRYSAWEFNEERGQFYLHQFVPGQPDLNYRNPSVRREMNDILTFWMEKGVDGFRFDAVLHIFEDDQFRDEPRSGNPDAVDENDWFYLDHIYTYNLPETKDVALDEMYRTIKDFAAVSADQEDRVDMLECALPPEENAEFYAVSDYPFNFEFIFGVIPPADAETVEGVINDIIGVVPEGKVPNWVLGNHDNWRIGDRLGEELIDNLNLLILTLPGVAVTYYGEEIGMVNNMDIAFEDTVDPRGCNCGPDRYLEADCSRDPERTPMQWSADDFAGFSSVDPWLPVNPNYETLNVAAQRADFESHYTIYKTAVGWRQSEAAFQLGSQTATVRNNNALSVVRFVPDDGNPSAYATVINFGDTEETINVLEGVELPQGPKDSGIVLINTTGNAGAVVPIENLVLGPKQGLLLSLINQP